MRKLLIAGVFSLAMVPGAKAQDGGLIALWTGVVVAGAATVMCTAQVLGDIYQGACEGAGGTFRFQGNGDPWRCFLPDEPQPAQTQLYADDPVKECVAGLLASG